MCFPGSSVEVCGLAFLSIAHPAPLTSVSLECVVLRCELACGFPLVAHPGTLHTSTLQCYSSWGFLPYHFIARVRPRLAWICWNKFITNYILVVLVECVLCTSTGNCHVMFTILPNDKTTGGSPTRAPPRGIFQRGILADPP